MSACEAEGGRGGGQKRLPLVDSATMASCTAGGGQAAVMKKVGCCRLLRQAGDREGGIGMCAWSGWKWE